MVDVLDGLLGLVAFALEVFVFRLGHAVERCHAHPEELIEIVGVNTQKSHPFEYGNGYLLCFLQDAVVEEHPADVAFNVGTL